MISKLSLLLLFGKVEAEIIEIRGTEGHLSFHIFRLFFVIFLNNFNKEFLKINFFSIFFVKFDGDIAKKQNQEILC